MGHSHSHADKCSKLLLLQQVLSHLFQTFLSVAYNNFVCHDSENWLYILQSMCFLKKVGLFCVLVELKSKTTLTSAMNTTTKAESVSKCFSYASTTRNSYHQKSPAYCKDSVIVPTLFVLPEKQYNWKKPFWVPLTQKRIWCKERSWRWRDIVWVIPFLILCDGSTLYQQYLVNVYSFLTNDNYLALNNSYHIFYPASKRRHFQAICISCLLPSKAGFVVLKNK